MALLCSATDLMQGRVVDCNLGLHEALEIERVILQVGHHERLRWLVAVAPHLARHLAQARLN
jgi:hypothetical protein